MSAAADEVKVKCPSPAWPSASYDVRFPQLSSFVL